MEGKGASGAHHGPLKPPRKHLNLGLRMPPRGCANERCLALAAGEFPDPDGTGRWHNVASKGGLVMRQIDFAPLYRSTVGFDRLFDMLDSASGIDAGPTAYPPYNIER